MRRIAEPSVTFSENRACSSQTNPAVPVMQRLAWAKICFVGQLRVTTPWTDKLAVIAAVNTVAHQWAKCFRNSAFPLNGGDKKYSAARPPYTAPTIAPVGQMVMARRRICRNLPRPAGRPRGKSISSSPEKNEPASRLRISECLPVQPSPAFPLMGVQE